MGGRPDKELGHKLWKSTQELTAAMAEPKIPATVIYTDTQEVQCSMCYKEVSDDLSKPPGVKAKAPGDGTLLASAIENLCQEWTKRGAKVQKVNIQASQGQEAPDHQGLVS